MTRYSLALFLCLLLPAPLLAEPHAPLTSGILTFKPASEEAETTPAPLLDTDVKMDISGLIARVTVTQTFKNTTSRWQEASYMFPLPENAAVDHLKMIIGERVVEGEIREKQKAQKIYLAAKKAGKKASLVNQNRPNVFTTKLANIGPGEEISVTIQYQQTLSYNKGEFSLRFPLVVGPRYTPQRIISEQITGNSEDGWTLEDPDNEIITSDVIGPGSTRKNPVSIDIDLNAGMELSSLTSPSHDIAPSEISAGRWRITLANDDEIANRDFVFNWSPKLGQEPKAALFRETTGDDNYYLMMLMPSASSYGESTRLPKESIFIIDTSGSMHGQSLAQAKAALALAIRGLNPSDSFNVIEFNSITTPLFPQSRPVTPSTVEQALYFVNGLQSDGGTEMAPALQLALNTPGDQNRLRQVIFLTDGAIGNEEQLFSLINDRLGDGRLFTVGIGSAPNSFFMRKAAEFGRGTFTHIGSTEEVSGKMQKLFAKLSAPVMTNIRILWPEETEVEMWPERQPDLYLNEPLIIKAKSPLAGGTLRIEGRLNNALWKSSLPLDTAREDKGVAQVWARQKIAGLTDKMREGGDREKLKAEMTSLALAHHMVSKYTSLVAVDKTPARPPEETLDQKTVPQHMPKGWSHDKVLGEKKAKALMAPQPTVAPPAADMMVASAPQTATDEDLKLALGLILCLGAAIALLFRRRIA
ncbi:marine proteobacterial sortase target protein [Emcibacter sp.]|uniref:marine proteobacterial sortase target protein n=1 Tax=Emcibacter sp. TaxID=1979954 RepID=UPI002AA8051F|nr:marine proteobacterial sortase target protein [Emcibacter sp.]